MPETAGIILAAGKGTRMKSDLPKALHLVAGLPMVEWIARAMRSAGIGRIAIVVGHGGELVRQTLGEQYEYVWQREQLGTGHAAQMTASAFKEFDGSLLIAPGDTPLLTACVFEELLAAHPGHVCTFATSVIDDPSGYGRVLRGLTGSPTAIVEDKDTTREQKAIREVSAALYVFDAKALYRYLPLLSSDNAQGEYYLPELIGIFACGGEKLNAVQFQDPAVLMGVNDRWQLAMAEREVRQAILKKHALAGVTLLDPDSTFIGPDVQLEVDTVIEAGTSLLGATSAGARCRLGPNTRIKDSRLGDDVTVLMSHVIRAEIGHNVKCGPFANLRPGTRLGNGVKIGNFVEVKNSHLGERVSASHLTYLGDSDIGADTNIGAGVITCNYDGFLKHRTSVGERAFVGSNSTLIAPVSVGDDSIVAAASAITEDVPNDAGAFARARQETKPGWAARRRERKSKS